MLPLVEKYLHLNNNVDVQKAVHMLILFPKMAYNLQNKHVQLVNFIKCALFEFYLPVLIESVFSGRSKDCGRNVPH